MSKSDFHQQVLDLRAEFREGADEDKLSLALSSRAKLKKLIATRIQQIKEEGGHVSSRT